MVNNIIPMRILATILALTIVLAAGAQTITKTVIKVGGVNQIVVNGATASDSVQYLPSGCGAPTINMANYISKKHGSAIYTDTCADVGYLYSPSTDTWYTLATGGAGTFFGLTDVDSAGIQDGDIPYYDAASGDILFQSFSVTGTVYYPLDSLNTPPV